MSGVDYVVIPKEPFHRKYKQLKDDLETISNSTNLSVASLANTMLNALEIMFLKSQSMYPYFSDWTERKDQPKNILDIVETEPIMEVPANLIGNINKERCEQKLYIKNLGDVQVLIPVIRTTIGSLSFNDIESFSVENYEIALNSTKHIMPYDLFCFRTNRMINRIRKFGWYGKYSCADAKSAKMHTEALLRMLNSRTELHNKGQREVIIEPIAIADVNERCVHQFSYVRIEKYIERTTYDWQDKLPFCMVFNSVIMKLWQVKKYGTSDAKNYAEDILVVMNKIKRDTENSALESTGTVLGILGEYRSQRFNRVSFQSIRGLVNDLITYIALDNGYNSDPNINKLEQIVYHFEARTKEVAA